MRDTHSRLSLIVAFLIFLQGSFGAWWSPSWPEDQLPMFSDVSRDIGLGFSFQGRVVALSDWDHNNAIDLMLIGRENVTLEISSWNEGNHSFWIPSSSAHRFNLSGFLSMDQGEILVGAVAADFNRDGKQDAIVTTSKGNAIFVNGRLSTVQALTLGTPIVDPLSLNALNVFGNCASPDVVAQTPQGLAIFQNGDTSVGCALRPDSSAPNFTLTKVFQTTDGYDGYSAAVDVDGNCLPKIILRRQLNTTTRQYELYAAINSAPALTFRVPMSFGLPTWGDFNGDGITDVLFPACSLVMDCSTEYQFIVILLNRAERPPCPDDDCCQPHGASFPDITFPVRNSPQVMIVNLTETCGAAAMKHSITSGVFRALDWNNDRRDDVLFATDRILLLVSNGGLSFSCLYPDGGVGKPLGHGQSLTPFYFDLLDDGKVDIFSTRSSGDGVFAYWNNLDSSEQYFFGATTMNGAQASAEAPWGAPQVNAVHRFQWQDIDQAMQTAGATQLSSMQYAALQIPRMHFGLGKTFSYIQGYSTGMRIVGAKRNKHYASWPVFLVPNSQVICPAYPMLEPQSWEIKLFFTPIRYLTLIFVSLAVALAVIGLPILALRYREYKEDKALKGYLAQ